MDDLYELIRRNMNSIWPVKLPKHKKILELLKLLWPTEEEAKIISVFKEPLLDQKSPSKISKLTGIPLDQVIEVCEHMAKKGVIAKDGKKFAMFPPAPGIMDYYFISKSDSKENLEKVAKLWLEIESLGLANEIGSSNYPLFRTLPASSLPQKLTKDIEINQQLEVQHEILIFEDVERYIKQAKSIRLVNCVCRTYHALAGEPECKKPVDICIYLNMGSEMAKALNRGKEITQEEALKLVKIAEDHGLVHNIINGSSPDTANVICNCCACHCSILGALIKYDNPHAIARSNFRPQLLNSNCQKCEKCIQICPMKALWHHWPHKEDLSDDFLILKEPRCIGCGLCAHHCPNNAIQMKKLYNDIPADNLASVLRKADSNRLH